MRRPCMVVAAFYENKPPRPLKFKFIEQQSDLKINVDRLISADIMMMRSESNKMERVYKFLCESISNGFKQKYVLTYFLDSCKWYIEF